MCRFSQYGSVRRIPGILLVAALSAALVCCRQNCYAEKEDSMDNMRSVNITDSTGSAEDIGSFEAARQLKVPGREEVLGNHYIYRYNHQRMREKGLITGETIDEKYLYLQALYRANLDAYLKETLNLEMLDEMLKSSELGFVSPESGEKNLYEKESAMDLEFVYLRNNLYIENLDKRQLEQLEEHLKTGDTAVTDELKTLAAETYKEVIRVREPGNWDSTGTFLYPAETGYEPDIPNEALVLAFVNCAEYDEAGNFLSGDNMEQKCEYLKKLGEEKEREYTGKLGNCVHIIVH